MKCRLLLYNILLSLSASLMADNYVIINQVMYDTPFNEIITHPPFSNGEFVELYNGSNNAVSLQGWCITGDGVTEQFNFPDISIPSKGYLCVVYRHAISPLFTLDSLYTLSTSNLNNYQIVYQNSVILANSGETIELKNAAGMVVDQLYYNGTSHKTKPDCLSAENADSIQGCQCVSLHRTWVEFDTIGLVVPGTSQWKTDFISIGACTLAETSFGEHYLTGNQPLPTDENYIISVTPLDPTTRVTIDNNGVSVSNGVRTNTIIQYYDGLGRSCERINIEATPARNDLVQISNYKGLHCATQQWLPVPAMTAGQYIDVSDVHTQAVSLYSDNRPYAETLYENSALERTIGNKRQGETWESHPSTITYSTNNESDNVRIYTVLNNGKLKTTGDCYSAYALYKTTVADEDGIAVTTYTDKLGRTILEERNGNRTYYVYDNLGHLRFVLPHIPSSRLNNGEYSLRDSTLSAAAYCYLYNERGYMKYKRLPECNPEHMIYDQLGQLVLKQNGNQRTANKWTLYAYDSIGRNLYAAEIVLSQNYQELESLFADKWQVEHYGNNQPNAIVGTGYASTILGTNDLHLLTVNYYDNYDFLEQYLSSVRKDLRFVQESGYGLQHDNATGLLTGTRIECLSEDGYTATAYYYDTKGRSIQNRSVRSIDGYKTATSTEYMFDGAVAQQLSIQGTDSNRIREHYRYNYDHSGRAKNIFYKLNDNEEIALSELSYDDMGRLVQNLLHNQKDTIRYSYDMRSMLTESHNKHFSEYLLYGDLPADTHPYATACYNGNISVQTVISAAGGYTLYNEYDGQNRLTRSSRNPRFNNIDLEEVFTYDEVGNIVLLRRHNGFHYIDILNFYYGNNGGNQVLSITDSGTDADQYNTIEYHNNNLQSDIRMRYDANGNLVYDADRNISAIHYNILNLPDTIQFTTGHQIVNMYDASGLKYKSIVYTNIASANMQQYDFANYSFETDSLYCTVTEYSGNIETYTTRDTAITVRHRVFNTIGYNSDNIYYHYIKDHLGNICAVVNSMQDTAVQSTLYYASGVPIARSLGREEQPYLYNGKEFIEAHGYNTYDYGFRGYYATIGRFTSVDPLTEQTPWQSPYTYANNNPINNIDLMGLSGMMSGYTSTYGYVAVDENGIVLDFDLKHPDKGVYQVDDEEWDRTYLGLLRYKLIGRQKDDFNYQKGKPGEFDTSGGGYYNADWNCFVKYGIKPIDDHKLLYDILQKTLFQDELILIVRYLEILEVNPNYVKLLKNLSEALTIVAIIDIYKRYEVQGITPELIYDASKLGISIFAKNSLTYFALISSDIYVEIGKGFNDMYNQLNNQLNDYDNWGDLYLNGYDRQFYYE